MRSIANECIAWAKDMSKANIDKLNSQLNEKFGEGLNDGWKAKKVNSIIAKRKIKSLQEYALLKEYFEEILSDPEKENETNNIESILVEYQLKTGII